MPTYPVTSKENSRRIRLEIHRVFLEVWDPIGIKDEPNAQDEYDSYIGRTFELLLANADDKALDDYLTWVAGRMGMDASRSTHADIIAALRAIDLREPEQAQSTDLA
jgi:hypothetical protein